LDKVNIGTKAYVYPMPVSIVGATVGGKPNFLAVAWLNMVNFNPPIVMLSLGGRKYTVEGIEEHKTFSVNFPAVDLMEKTDYCGLVSGRKADKSQLFEVFYGELKTAPMVKECPLSLECKLHSTHSMPSNTLYFGEIVGAYTDERYLTSGKPDMGKMNLFVLTMPDSNYWALGKQLDKAWKVGLKLK